MADRHAGEKNGSSPAVTDATSAAPDYEGACRHIVKDRMDITGARWGLEGAEAILKLRALIASGDFEDYWHFHLRREHERIHGALYRESLVLAA